MAIIRLLFGLWSLVVRKIVGYSPVGRSSLVGELWQTGKHDDTARNCVVCTTSGAVCGGYKRMLGRKKRYTEPAGKKKWSDDGQEV